MHQFLIVLLCFFKQKTAYEMRISDWSSDVCSSDLVIDPAHREEDCAVSAFFRSARRLCAAGTFPIRTRAARSAPASAPRWEPTAPSTTTSAGRSEERRVGKEGVSTTR